MAESARTTLLDGIKSVLVVTALALFVWLVAESETLGEAEIQPRVEVVTPPESGLIVRTAIREPRIKVGLRGGKAALQRARSVLESPVRLEPGRDFPESDGRHTIDLLEALRRYEPLSGTRVTVDWVSPPRVDLEVESLDIVSLPIVTDLPDVQVEGTVIVEPAAAEVRAPRSVIDTLTQDDAAIAAPTPEQAEQTTIPGPHSISAPVRLPASLTGTPGVTLLTDRTRLEFTVVSTRITETIPAVPVQVLLAPTEASEWRVVVQDQDQILSVDLTGPRAVMAELKSVSFSIVAVLSLSDLDLQSGMTSKGVGFAVLRDGVLTSLPREVTVRAQRSEVRFTTERVAEP